MESSCNSNSIHELCQKIIGVWWLLSREDFTADGSAIIDPSLGANPLGILTYTPSRFAAQFMKRNRSNDTSEEISIPGRNNTGAIGGYDAYFGTYEVDKESGEVIHHLEGALTVSNVGINVSRKLQVEGDRLVIQLDTTTADGEQITRTLKWQRIG